MTKKHLVPLLVCICSSVAAAPAWAALDLPDGAIPAPTPGPAPATPLAPAQSAAVNQPEKKNKKEAEGAVVLPGGNAQVQVFRFGGNVQAGGPIILGGGIGGQPGLRMQLSGNDGAAAPAPRACAEGFADCIRMGNKDAFYGRMLSFTPENGVAWLYEDGAAPFVFKHNRLDSIELGRALPPAADADVLVTLQNGDAFQAAWVAFSAEKITLKTAFAGQVALPCAAIRDLAFFKNHEHNTTDLLEKMTDWTALEGGKGPSKAGSKAVLPAGESAARQVAWPELFRLNVQVPRTACEGNQAFNIRLFAGEQGAGEWNQLSLTFRRGGLVQAQQNTGTNVNGAASSSTRYLASYRLPAGEKKLSLSILADAKTKNVTLLADGEKVGTLHLNGPFPKAKGLSLACGGAPLTVERLNLLPWDGRMPAANAPAATVPADGKDSVVLANQDVLQGRILAVTGGKASVKTELGTVDIPLDRILRCHFSGAPKPDAKPAANPVRFFFDDSDNSLGLDLRAIKDGRVTGVSPVLGECAFGLDSVQKMNFNPDAPFRKPAAAAEAGKPSIP